VGKEEFLRAHRGLAARRRCACLFARSRPCGGCAVCIRGQSSAAAHELLKALGAARACAPALRRAS
jgi:hypothetical protein